jgi:hypothetical protein
MTMPATQELTTNEHSPLFLAIQTVKRLHAGDPDLVREGAKHHGVSVTTGSMIDAITPHAYNFRIPEGTTQEIQAIKEATTLVVGCMDYRQSDAIAKRHPDTPLFFTAGGAAQPNIERLEADVIFVAESFKSNKNQPKIELYVHTGVCGGANHFTDGAIKKIHDENSNQESTAMEGFGIEFVRKLQMNGVPGDHIKLHAVDINNDNTIAAIRNVPMPEFYINK